MNTQTVKLNNNTLILNINNFKNMVEVTSTKNVTSVSVYDSREVNAPFKLFINYLNSDGRSRVSSCEFDHPTDFKSALLEAQSVI